MSVTIETSLTVVNEMDIRAQQILDLCAQYIAGFKGRYKGHRPFGAEDVTFPAIMVEPIRQVAEMITTAKYDLRFFFNIYFYVVNNTREGVFLEQTEFAEALLKLFSNDALDDLQTANPPSNRFKRNPGYWINSEMKPVAYSATFAWSKPDGNAFARAGLLSFECLDRVIK